MDDLRIVNVDAGVQIGLGLILVGAVVVSSLHLRVVVIVDSNGEFDPGSGRTLAACLTHASRAGGFGS
jgi:hypothetical protein